MDRFFTFMESHLSKNVDFNFPSDVKSMVHSAVLDLDAVPSMRALMTAGPALERDNVAGYNCAYLPVDSPRSFDECLYVLMCGTGVGFSVERQYINKLPEVNEHFENSNTTIVVEDSKAGWARAFRELLSMLYAGQVPKWDLSKLRPAGARLKTFGGRSSGPGPLDDLFHFTVETFIKAAGRKLTSLECHDLMCKVGDVVVVGGVRRSALISLSNLTDDRMRDAKAGQWWEQNGHRRLANNSVCYTEKPEMGSFMKEWKALYDSKSGERGIFNRAGARKLVERIGRRDPDHDWGCNPCSEIILRPFQFCNLTEVIVRENDTLEGLKDKVRVAAILGTLQSTLTNFKYLRKVWQRNTEEERLLGVSLTGVMDHPVLNGNRGIDYTKEWLKELKQVAVHTNKVWAEHLGIPQSTAVTCVKPSGTVSQLAECASGLHPEHSQFYIRRVRGDKKDPLTQFMIAAGFGWEDDVMKPDQTVVFDFPRRAGKGAVTRDMLSAIEHLEMWKLYQNFWCEHKPSITVTVKEDEWMKVGAWVYENFDEVSGISFLPHSNHTYKQAPYEVIGRKDYEALVKAQPKNINWSGLSEFEEEDHTRASQELACSGNVCEIVDINA